MEWDSVIGLEIHVQLATKSKLFSSASTQFGAAPNHNVTAIDLGFPGTLPVLNQEAVRLACLFGIAINAKISSPCSFDRKNYFYPDLPKGYQVSQANTPILVGGDLVINLEQGTKAVRLHHAHLEEDAGKSLHGVVTGQSGIDLNRAGTPLLEIVTEPDLNNAEQAVALLKQIHSLVRYLGISDGNMNEGSLRCDANISVRPKGETQLGVRTEVKNLNSFKFIEQAINYEIARHVHVLETGGALTQETRLYDPDRHETRPMRSKEDANDYRYFPEPDLLPVIIPTEMLEQLREQLPELEAAKFQRYQRQYKLSEYDARQLSQDIVLARYFERTLELTGTEHAKLLTNWILSELLGALNKRNLELTENPLQSEQLAQLIQRLADDSISGKIAKSLFEQLLDNPSPDPNAIDLLIKAQGLEQVSDTSELKAMVDQVIDANPTQVSAYQSATPDKRQKMLGFFIGQLMQRTQGKANPKVLNQLLQELLPS